ncbi:MAG: hypothetical protein EB828_02640 [Nitrosopumilus sp. D6]|nr:MAG: hypothetical protein EB828_02640 [Nitrosopumilus sp. D6]
MFEFIQEKNEKPNYLIGGDWQELKKAWNKYEKALSEKNFSKMERCRCKIHSLQEKLGMKKTDFS